MPQPELGGFSSPER